MHFIHFVCFLFAARGTSHRDIPKELRREVQAATQILTVGTSRDQLNINRVDSSKNASF